MQKTGIVIPCYNEELRLNLNEFVAFAQSHLSIEFLFVNDGSTDDTLSVLNKLKISCNGIGVLNLENNVGKSEAVRLGMLEMFDSNKYEYIGFWDADLATPLNEILHLLNHQNSSKNKVIMASRLKRMGAMVERKGSRHLLGRVFSTFASIILKLPVYDTQCGAKLFHQSLRHLFEQKFQTKWLFDIELLARFRNKYGMSTTLNEIIEVPVRTWVEVGGSKLKLTHMLKVPLELLKIRRIYNHA